MKALVPVSKQARQGRVIVPRCQGWRRCRKERSAEEIILELLAESAGVREESLRHEQLTRGTGLADKTVKNDLTKLKANG
jgi:hypothetical protein